MESEKGTSVGTMIARKEKLPPSQHHFFFTDHQKDYFLFLNQGSGFLVIIKEGKASILKEFKLETICILKFASTGYGDIHILHSKGILWHNIEHIIQEIPFSSLNLPGETKPLNFVYTEKESYVVVCEEQFLLIIENKNAVKKVNYPSNFAMESIMVDMERRESFEPRLAVPCRDLSFPSIFSCRELLEWKNQNYLQKITGITKKYYMKDERFSETPKGIIFSSAFNKMYALFSSQLMILSIKRSGGEQMDYLIGIRMKVNLQMKDLPSFVRVNTKTGALLMIAKKKIVERDPANYIKMKLSIKQKNEGMIACGYNLSDDSSYVFLSKEQACTRLRIVATD